MPKLEVAYPLAAKDHVNIISLMSGDGSKMKIRLTFEKGELFNNHGNLAFHEFYIGHIIEGAIAFAQGQPVQATPYDSSTPAFHSMWKHGWERASKGKIKVKIFKGK